MNSECTGFPSTKISGTVIQGWENICSLLEEHLKAYPALAVDFYTGVYEEEVINELHRLSPALFIDTRFPQPLLFLLSQLLPHALSSVCPGQNNRLA